jgi:hypothetical protein
LLVQKTNTDRGCQELIVGTLFKDNPAVDYESAFHASRRPKLDVVSVREISGGSPVLPGIR